MCNYTYSIRHPQEYNTCCASNITVTLTIVLWLSVSIIEEYYTNQIMRINQYVVYTSPVKIVSDFTEACKLADDYFNETGYIVAVEETNPVVYPEYEVA